MSRHQPTQSEQEAIDLLIKSGYAVRRQATYNRLLERISVAEVVRDMEIERRESAEQWARRECDEQRRLADRLTEVVGAAASLGVSIQTINEALSRPGKEHDDE